MTKDPTPEQRTATATAIVNFALSLLHKEFDEHDGKATLTPEHIEAYENEPTTTRIHVEMADNGRDLVLRRERRAN
jgi:hypothetical protein